MKTNIHIEKLQSASGLLQSVRWPSLEKICFRNISYKYEKSGQSSSPPHLTIYYSLRCVLGTNGWTSSVSPPWHSQTSFNKWIQPNQLLPFGCSHVQRRQHEQGQDLLCWEETCCWVSAGEQDWTRCSLPGKHAPIQLKIRFLQFSSHPRAVDDPVCSTFRTFHQHSHKM